jgi:hypothetical protein
MSFPGLDKPLQFLPWQEEAIQRLAALLKSGKFLPLPRLDSFPSCARDYDRMLQREKERFYWQRERLHRLMTGLTIVCAKCGARLTFLGLDMWGTSQFQCDICNYGNVVKINTRV